MRVFWRKVGLWLLFTVLLVACGGAGEPAAPGGEPQVAEPAGVEAVEPAGEAGAAQVQFIEFYADW